MRTAPVKCGACFPARPRRSDSIRYPHTIVERGAPVGRDRDAELRGPCIGPGPLVRRAQDSPGAAYGLIHFDRDGRGLVIAEEDLVLDLVDVRANLLEVDLFPLGDDIESVSDLQFECLIGRGVLDAVLAHELRPA